MSDSIKNEKASISIMVATLISRLLGIIKTRAIATIFGVNETADVINFTYNIPNSTRKLFAEGAFTHAFIPIFTNLKDDKKQTEKLIGLILTFQLLLFIPMFLLCYVFGYQIISFLSDFQAEWQISLGSSLLPLFVIFLAFISFSSVFSGLLQSRLKFFIQALSPLAFSLSVIFSIYLLNDKIGPYSLALGTIIGAFFQWMICYFACRSFNLKIRIDFNFKDPMFSLLIQRWIPITFSSIVAIISQQIIYYFASTLDAGSVTALSNSIVIWQTPYGIILPSIAAVFMPLFASSKSEGERNDKLSLAMTQIITLMLPCTLILLALNKECVAVLLQRGQFTLESTYITASVLFYYLISMTFVALYTILQRFIFSKGENWKILKIVLPITIIDLFLTYFLINNGFKASGISLSHLITNALAFSILLLTVKGFNYKPFLKQITKILLANIPLLLLLLGYKYLNLNWWQSGSTLVNFMIFGFIGLFFLAITFITYYFVRIPFLEAFLRRKK